MLRLLRDTSVLLASLAFVARGMAAPVDFVRDVRPILQQHCYACHGAEKQKSGLRVDIKSEAMRGGELYGPSIVPGDAEESPLIQFISSEEADLRMPPEGELLPAAEIALLSRWVNEGAVWPDGVDLAKLEDKADHWSFEPVRDPPLPSVERHDWPRTEVDHFVLARLEQAGLQPAPEADRGTWLRRVSLDLTGLPPTPDRVQAFVADDGSDAYERAVDELLASARYGERWAQHWLDVVRYADTHGFEVNTERPNAWPYRDYVIAAFNDDLPYNEFIRQQVAGDAFGKAEATGFLVTASVLLPGQIGKDAPSIRLARQDALDEIVVNIGQTFLGLTIGCARCHDHKFDAISHRDYYAMQALVAGVEYGDREWRPSESELRPHDVKRLRAALADVEKQLATYVPLAKTGTQRPPVNARINIDRFTPVDAKRLRFTIQATNQLEPCLDELEVFDIHGTQVALASAGATVTSSGDNEVPDRHELRFVNDGNYGNSRSWMSNQPGKGWVIVEFPAEVTLDRVVWGRDREGKFTDRLAVDYRIDVADASGEWRLVADAGDRVETAPKAILENGFSLESLPRESANLAQKLVAKKKQLEAKLADVTTPQQVFAGVYREPDVIRLLRRGDPEQPEDEVVPAVPGAVGSLVLPAKATEQQRRVALADWIADAKNPLTARVLVNRLWQGHFGTGLVETPNDFGRNGALPSHPELLDWLASEFVRSGWSIKHLHRRVVLSATYRQAARHASAAAGKDADVRLLWRYPSRRLEGEAIRDSVLAVNGSLNLKQGGAGFDLFDRRGGLSGFRPVESFSGDGLRRMIYAHKVRRERDAVFGAFDCPDGGQSAARRRESTTPIQALNLFNSRFTLEQAEAFATRVRAEAGEETEHQIQRAYQLALNRLPSEGEVSDAAPVVAAHGLAVLCRALFNSNEFLFLP